MPQDMCVSSFSQQQKTMEAGTQCQQKMRQELCPAPAGLISMVNIVYSFSQRCATCSALHSEVVIHAVCCTFSTVASERPRTHEESHARQPLRRSDRPGARHQVSFPHVRHQPHPVLQLPARGRAGERGAVSPSEDALGVGGA